MEILRAHLCIGQLLGGGSLVQVGADGYGVVGIYGAIAGFDVADDAIFVDDDIGAKSPLIAFALHVIGFQDAVGREHLVIHIAEEGEPDADLLSEGCVGGG